MNDTYENLNYITLYKTPMFNVTDTVFFESETARDNYFNNINVMDKLTITDYTDLYADRVLYLPYNYLDLKKYNTMKLHYDDGLGHVEDYYCNVDNYIYVSSEVCSPLYRIDYFLTYGHLLKNKTIGMITDRRTVKESDITRNMKADEMIVPRLKYTKYDTFRYFNEEINYIVYLNKTPNNVGKKGIKCTMGFYLGLDENDEKVFYKIDDFTIGCYLAVVKASYLTTFLDGVPAEYIEKIVESNVNPGVYLSGSDLNNYNTNYYVYVNNDCYPTENGAYYKQVEIEDINYSFLPTETENIYPTHDKKVMNWLPTKGVVIQANEFDIKDFDNNDFPTDDRVVERYPYLNSTIYLFNFFGYTFAYPIGYRGENINRDYMIKWQSARNFSYTSDYTNSLAYKELMEYNSQAQNYAIQNASINSYYTQQLANNTNTQLDISKKQSDLSYQAQINSTHTSYKNTMAQTTGFSGMTNTLSTFLTGGVLGAFGNLFSLSANLETGGNNLNLLQSQENILKKQKANASDLISLQQQANSINAQYQCDTIALARDNALANISISNKYNNAKPNAYYETDFTQFSSYYYIFEIDTDNETDFSHVENIRTHYNVLGTYVGYFENWNTNVTNGAYFDYIKGSVINNANILSNELDYDVYTNLILRIENGVRLWHLDALDWFGNLSVDNTFSDIPEPLTNLTESDKSRLEHIYYIVAYQSAMTKDYILEYIRTQFTLSEESINYITWLHSIIPWGTSEIPDERKTKIERLCSYLLSNYDRAMAEKVLKRQVYLTIYEKKYGIAYMRR